MLPHGGVGAHGVGAHVYSMFEAGKRPKKAKKKAKKSKKGKKVKQESKETTAEDESKKNDTEMKKNSSRMRRRQPLQVKSKCPSTLVWPGLE